MRDREGCETGKEVGRDDLLPVRPLPHVHVPPHSSIQCHAHFSSTLLIHTAHPHARGQQRTRSTAACTKATYGLHIRAEGSAGRRAGQRPTCVQAKHPNHIQLHTYKPHGDEPGERPAGQGKGPQRKAAWCLAAPLTKGCLAR
eukprot:13285-Chlamydomonas_euryale.AAC.1